MTKLSINIKLNKLTLLGYLCFLLSFIFGIVGMSIDPAINTKWSDDSSNLKHLHSNVTMQNTTFSMFAQTLALMGLGFLYAGNH